MKTSLRAVTAAVALAFAVPASAANIVATAQDAGQFNTLLAAAQAAGLATPLSEGGPFTVFAPTDEAFEALPAGTVETLLQPENRDQLADILKYHVLPRELTSNMLPGRTIHVRTIKEGGGRPQRVAKDGGVTVDNATVIAADIKADNGVIHVIDAVMLPSN